jgi:hypothetical protein
MRRNATGGWSKVCSSQGFEGFDLTLDLNKSGTMNLDIG